MLANYGYSDGSGNYYITIDTDKCNACGKCLTVCPSNMFELMVDDYDDEAATVKPQNRKQLKYDCTQCKPDHDRQVLPCVNVCEPGAIKHSW